MLIGKKMLSLDYALEIFQLKIHFRDIADMIDVDKNRN